MLLSGLPRQQEAAELEELEAALALDTEGGPKHHRAAAATGGLPRRQADLWTALAADESGASSDEEEEDEKEQARSGPQRQLVSGAAVAAAPPVLFGPPALLGPQSERRLRSGRHTASAVQKVQQQQQQEQQEPEKHQAAATPGHASRLAAAQQTGPAALETPSPGQGPAEASTSSGAAAGSEAPAADNKAFVVELKKEWLGRKRFSGGDARELPEGAVLPKGNIFYLPGGHGSLTATYQAGQNRFAVDSIPTGWEELGYLRLEWRGQPGHFAIRPLTEEEEEEYENGKSVKHKRPRPTQPATAAAGAGPGSPQSEGEEHPAADEAGRVLHNSSKQQTAAGTSGSKERVPQVASGSRKRQRNAAPDRLDAQAVVGAAPQGQQGDVPARLPLERLTTTSARAAPAEVARQQPPPPQQQQEEQQEQPGEGRTRPRPNAEAQLRFERDRPAIARAIDAKVAHRQRQEQRGEWAARPGPSAADLQFIEQLQPKLAALQEEEQARQQQQLRGEGPRDWTHQPATCTSGSTERVPEAASGSMKRQRRAPAGRVIEQEPVGAAPQVAVLPLVHGPAGDQQPSPANPQFQPKDAKGTPWQRLIADLNGILKEAEEQHGLPEAAANAYMLNFINGIPSGKGAVPGSLQRSFDVLVRLRNLGRWDVVMRFVTADLE
ncbi:hypothetical protein N2152v2_002963 [Parachlorella kessleri]